ncbi:substrate-binding periplasmic protein [Undibacterium fentianense]|uniref:Transporter substrate-binding domain-containing protein n=1 Tax=Undibacterium fentianense TaxID=2828728 RepID=A0A941IHB2_9BURK|nr:ABC transporter substrate-binding protein [Undibacterium fentianense]MBR7800805.1 transporter substrate-binding domain-containing protein [Undibacterium fentianense]
MTDFFHNVVNPNRRYLILTLFSALVSSQALALERPVLRGVTHEDAYPYNYKFNSRINGLVYDIAKILSARIGYALDIQTQPWTRALQTARDNSSIMIFSLARNPERENAYYWIGPVAHSEVWLFKLKDRTDIHLKALEDLRQYTVGDIASSSTIALLKQYGTKIDTAPSNISNCRKLKTGRVDLVPFDPNGIKIFLHACDLKMEQIEKTLHLPRDTALYIAIGKTTPKSLVDQLNAELALMYKDKTMQKIHQQWQVEYKLPSP